MNNLVVSGLVDTGLSVNGERVFLKNDRKVVVRGNAVVVLADLGKPVSARFERRPRRRVRTNWTPVTVEFNGGQFDREKAAAAAEKARLAAMADPEKSGYGKRTNVGAGTAKGMGGSKPGRGTSNPRLAEKRARKAAQKKR